MTTRRNTPHRCLAARRLSGLRRPAIAAAGLVLFRVAGMAEVDYPGPSPGPAQISSARRQITVSNQALSVAWSLSPRGLKAQSVHDVPAGNSLTLTGEVFQIVLADGTGYAASALTPERMPVRTKLTPKPAAARFAERVPGRQVEVPLRSADGRIAVRWRVIARDGGNYVRQEIEAVALAEDVVVKEITWLGQTIPGARTAGRVDGSPIVAGNFFLGCEDPMAVNEAGPSGVVCRLPRNATLRRGEKLTQSFVLGVAPPGQMRRAFLCYLERERAHPYRPFLHYNSWYDVSWPGTPMNETNCLAAIRAFGEDLIQPFGVTMDAMVFDDGWDDPKTLWQFHRGFPDGFTPLAALCRRYQTRLGVWLSPFGGYGDAKAQRLRHGREQGYETNAAGFSLAGPKYYAAFRAACGNMIRRYGVGHFKFDGIASGMYANGAGAEYLRDTEAMRRLMLELRQEDPNLYINLTTGSWPSPFWLRYADSLWRQGGDMGLAGKGTQQQQWLTYRDQETYRNIVGKAPLYPLNALMTQGVAYSRHGSAGERTFDSGGFKDDVRAFFGSGTSLQELYLQPSRLTPADWQVLAEAAKWSRTNAAVLVDTHWLGGDPGRLEVYGYAAWSPRRGIVTLRNPAGRPQEFALDLRAAFELPPGAPTRYALQSPWAEDAGTPVRTAEAGKPLTLPLKPFEVMVLEAAPVR